MSAKTYAVIGIAPNALAVAAELHLRGHRVLMTERPDQRDALSAMAARFPMPLKVEAETVFGGPQQTVLDGIGFVPDAAEAVAQADVILPMIPAPFHEALFAGFAGRLSDDQILLAVPGGLGEALMLARIARQHGAGQILIAQTAAAPLAGRLGPEGLRISNKKKAMPVGVFPGIRTQELLDRLADDFPQFVASGNVIENGFTRASFGLHPVPMIMNATRIERDGPFVYDAYDITPSIARVIDAVDGERQAILAALGLPVSSFSEVLKQSYAVPGESFFETVHNVATYRQVQAPPDLRYRYLTEDVPTQVVPAAALGRALGVPTPVMNGIVAFAGAMHGVDYWAEGWNLGKLGLEGLDAAGIAALVSTGVAGERAAGAAAG